MESDDEELILRVKELKQGYAGMDQHDHDHVRRGGKQYGQLRFF